jgi:protein-disulfide isomerase
VRERILERSLEEFRRKQPLRIDLENSPVYYGRADARVVVVEFFNFDCVICREASTVLASIIDRYPGRVRLHLLHYPADARCNRNVPVAGDALSCRASLIAIALQHTQHYRAFVSSLLKTRRPLSRQLVRNALAGVGMDTERLKSITNERDAEKTLVMQIIQAENAGIMETPSFVINGRALRAGLPPEWLLDALIREEIRRVYGD